MYYFSRIDKFDSILYPDQLTGYILLLETLSLSTSPSLPPPFILAMESLFFFLGLIRFCGAVDAVGDVARIGVDEPHFEKSRSCYSHVVTPAADYLAQSPTAAIAVTPAAKYYKFYYDSI